MAHPSLPSTVGKRVHTKDPDGTTTDYIVVEEIRRNDGEQKILLLQRLQRLNTNDDKILRFGYYIIGKRPKMLGKWTWGQFAPFITSIDFAYMISEAIKRKWFSIS